MTKTNESAQLAIESVLNGLLQHSQTEEVALFKQYLGNTALADAFSAAQQGQGEEFYFSLLYAFERLLDGLLESALPGKDKVHFILKNYHFIEGHFKKIIVHFEHGVYSADKSRTIMQVLLRFFISDQRIEFNYEAEYTYHLPRVVFTTHDQIVDFFEGLYRHYYGYPDQYLKQLALIYPGQTSVE